jgi:copper chaperone
MTDLTLTISGMSCGHCVASVSKALKGVDGVQVDDVRIGTAKLKFDESKVSAAQLAQLVTDEGYAATASA